MTDENSGRLEELRRHHEKLLEMLEFTQERRHQSIKAICRAMDDRDLFERAEAKLMHKINVLEVSILKLEEGYHE